MKVLDCHLRSDWYICLILLKTNDVYVVISSSPHRYLMEHKDGKYQETRNNVESILLIKNIGNFILANKLKAYVKSLDNQDRLNYLNQDNVVESFLELHYPYLPNSSQDNDVLQAMVDKLNVT